MTKTEASQTPPVTSGGAGLATAWPPCARPLRGTHVPAQGLGTTGSAAASVAGHGSWLLAGRSGARAAWGAGAGTGGHPRPSRLPPPAAGREGRRERQACGHGPARGAVTWPPRPRPECASFPVCRRHPGRRPPPDYVPAPAGSLPLRGAERADFPEPASAQMCPAWWPPRGVLHATGTVSLPPTPPVRGCRGVTVGEGWVFPARLWAFF